MDFNTQLLPLKARTSGTPEICVAVLDGPVDVDHPCFHGAALSRLPTLVSSGASAEGAMSAHGTHIASLLFGQPGSPVEGLVPRCRGLLVPVFADERRTLSQLDLARAIEQAVEAGAHVINVSGGELSPSAEADHLLAAAVRTCRDNNVLLVAAAGNDGCACLHVPAAMPAVLAVGALDRQGRPLASSNWGEAYRRQGLLAPGEDIPGAKPGGGTVRLSGTSFATPVVSGVAALLLSLQVEAGRKPDPRGVREALLRSALACDASSTEHESRCLAGRLNVSGAMRCLEEGEMMSEATNVVEDQALPLAASQGVQASCACGGAAARDEEEEERRAVRPQAVAMSPPPLPAGHEVAAGGVAASAQPQSSAVVAAQAPPQPAPQPAAPAGGGLAYALGTLGYDFATEARRDSFKQLMPAIDAGGTQVPANPHDARQMADYLSDNLSEARSLIWTLNLELTPIYALQPVGPFAREVYQVLQELLAGQVQAENAESYIERVSMPGRLTGGSVQLFSGQVLPVLAIESARGLYGWNAEALRQAALEAISGEPTDEQKQAAAKCLDSFLNRVYYELRNLGQTSHDRALNFAATNAFQAASTFSEAVGKGMELEGINVVRSPFCRMDSDCWDVILRFFDAENLYRARKVFRFTIDVSDMMPVTLGEVRSWSSG